MTLADFCAEHPEYGDCPTKTKVSCCTADTAECKACSSGKTLADFCAAYPDHDGCLTLNVKHARKGEGVHALSCRPPKYGFDLPHKGCGQDGDASACVAENEHFSTLDEAWEACGRFPECGVITRYIDDKYYLRRIDDPDEPVAGAKSVLYRCDYHSDHVALTCPPPVSGFNLPAKGCGHHGHNGYNSNCVASNSHFFTLGHAWKACGEYTACSIVMRWTDGMYYLRSSSDDDEPVAGAASMRYRC